MREPDSPFKLEQKAILETYYSMRAGQLPIETRDDLVQCLLQR
ncbi:hypothetical protein PSH28_04905 [Pseudomonas resinovorans]|nr:hypothetical protein [Pseudomonas resinovorans]MDE3735924.1 hypothetical protein [Pseudomonas resinovorans]